MALTDLPNPEEKCGTAKEFISIKQEVKCKVQ